MQSNGIKKYIDDKTEKYWDAFLSIDVRIKNGTEPVSADLKNEIEKSTDYLGLKTFLEKNDVTEIWLTDDYIDLYAPSFEWLLELFQGKEMITHICVAENIVAAVKESLNKACSIVQGTLQRWYNISAEISSFSAEAISGG